MPRERHWPGWQTHDALTARHAPEVARALSGLLPDREEAAGRILSAVRQVHPFDDGPVALDGSDREVVRALARSEISSLAVMPAEDTLHPLVYDAYAGGAKHAVADVAALRKADNPAAVAGSLTAVDWSQWTPGDVATAEDLLSGVDDAERLSSLLAEAGVTIKSVASNRLGELARAVADSIGEGTTVGDLAGVLSGILDDPSRADMVARTETTRVMVAGAFDTYVDASVGYGQVLSAEDNTTCSLCWENEEAGVFPLWDQPPNGWPPAHPNCRCTVLPALGPNG